MSFCKLTLGMKLPQYVTQGLWWGETHSSLSEKCVPILISSAQHLVLWGYDFLPYMNTDPRMEISTVEEGKQGKTPEGPNKNILYIQGIKYVLPNFPQWFPFPEK